MRISDWSSDVCSSDLSAGTQLDCPETVTPCTRADKMTDKPEFDLAVVIDDDEDILTAATLLLRRMFAEVLTAPNPQAALETLGGRLPDVVLLDANFARGATDAAEGLAWLGRLLAYDPDMAVVMITAHAGLQVAVAAMKRGATDFVSKP